MKKVAIVVPTIREHSIMEFVKKWDIQPSEQYDLLVVEDHATKEFSLPSHIKHYSHEDIDREFPNPTLIGRKTDAVRNFGFWKAYQEGYEYVITLDDDCYPTYELMEQFVPRNIRHFKEEPSSKWFNTLQTGFPRGYSESARQQKSQVSLLVGGWNNVPDIDGRTQMYYELNNIPFPESKDEPEVVPYGQMYTMCGMFVVFPRELIPYMYYLPTLNTYHRWADIWLGYIIKRWLDEKNRAIVNAHEMIYHSRASNAEKNFEAEHKNYGYMTNDEFAKYMFESYKQKFETFEDLLDHVGNHFEKNFYFDKTSKMFKEWKKLYD